MCSGGCPQPQPGKIAREDTRLYTGIEITRMNSTLEVMTKPFSVAGIPPDELNSFLSGTHGDAFRILGPHRMEIGRAHV